VSHKRRLVSGHPVLHQSTILPLICSDFVPLWEALSDRSYVRQTSIFFDKDFAVYSRFLRDLLLPSPAFVFLPPSCPDGYSLPFSLLKWLVRLHPLFPPHLFFFFYFKADNSPFFSHAGEPLSIRQVYQDESLSSASLAIHR